MNELKQLRSEVNAFNMHESRTCESEMDTCLLYIRLKNPTKVIKSAPVTILTKYCVNIIRCSKMRTNACLQLRFGNHFYTMPLHMHVQINGCVADLWGGVAAPKSLYDPSLSMPQPQPSPQDCITITAWNCRGIRIASPILISLSMRALTLLFYLNTGCGHSIYIY